ncbi:MAG TPA: hypothetical protein VN883_01430 [Myxococcales bacterium]|nr:hypothetical protein [Myxococcales bacterium]
MRKITRCLLPGLGALALLTTQARADEKVEQKSDTKTSSDGKKVKHHRESKRTMDTDNGAVTDKATTDEKTKSTIGGGTVYTSEKTKAHDERGNDAKVKEKTKVEKDSAGNVTNAETKVEKK